MPCGVGGGTHRSLVDGGVDQGPWLQERVGGSGLPCAVREGLAWRGKGRGGSKGFGSGGG